jgi:DNA-binding MarR family transcriptional regulator
VTHRQSLGDDSRLDETFGLSLFVLTGKVVVYTITRVGIRNKSDRAELAIISAEYIATECVAVRLRLLTRAVTKIYNKALRPHGLTISQMNILTAVSCLGEVKQQEVGHALHLEKSTLSRDIARIQAQGWIMTVSGEDGRVSLLRITDTGRKLLEKTFPAWNQAQHEAKALLGEKEVAGLSRGVAAVRAAK